MSDKNNPTILDIQYTFMWRTKDKAPALTPPIKNRLAELLKRDCVEIGFKNLGGYIGSSSVRITVIANANHSPQYIAQKFKGGTANILRTEFPELRETVDKTNLWESGYLCVTQQGNNGDIIEKYLS
ncbi:MAG: IS200/IS605 family transposase [Defluviitaleaceae bacterium]|nr:IS200/IS605 family transposase [Defluviitaleaceae bacterium]